tara:strand:- start:167 stop:463 length:297 start_codon:yes stop_codon:yes gene_type:complete
MLSLGNQVLLRKCSDRLVTRNRQDAGIDHHSAKLTGVIGPQVGNQPGRALGGLECRGMGSHVISQGVVEDACYKSQGATAPALLDRAFDNDGEVGSIG